MAGDEMRPGAAGFEHDELTEAQAARIADEIDADTQEQVDAATLADSILGGDE